MPLVAILALGLIGMAVSSASAAKPPLPFKASVMGSLSPTGISPTYTLEGTGIASRLGNVKLYQAGIVVTGGDPNTGPVTDVSTETLTAANGDTLTILCLQTADVISPGVLHGTDQWTVIGGTGQFDGATGSGTGETFADTDAGSFTKQLTGVIAY